MPGRNCAVIGCGSCRRTKGIGIFKLPLASDEIQKKWRDEWLAELKKTREVDQDFREQIKRDTVYTRGRKDRKRAWEQVTDDKLPCRKKLKYN